MSWMGGMTENDDTIVGQPLRPPTYHQNATDIIAYTHTAEMLCPGCIAARFGGECDRCRSHMTNAEEVLDAAARERGIDRQDETSYDSMDFPQVVFADSLGEHERCDTCGGEL